MRTVLALDKMTTADKIAAMEDLWDDLCRNPQGVDSPAWHGKVLSDREERIQSGKAGFSDLAVAKNRIRKATR